MPLWSILILTQPSRRELLVRLLEGLLPQVASHPVVNLVISGFDTACGLGENRQSMIDHAVGQYVNFIDDDDVVAPDYVATILPLLDGVDYVGFRLQQFTDGVKVKPTTHSLRYSNWSEDRDGYYRDISHMNPMRRELARQARMSGGVGEDHRWSNALRSLNILKSEHFIDRVMYFYHYQTRKP